MLTESMIPIIQQAIKHQERTAIIDQTGQYSYRQLLDAAVAVAQGLLEGRTDLEGRADLDEARITFLVPSGFEYVAVQWGIWLAGGIAVPLCTSHPLPEQLYVISDSDAACVVIYAQFDERGAALSEQSGKPIRRTTDLLATEVSNSFSLPELPLTRRAMILYTSGTTSKPKGVVTTHQNITAQITSLVEAWNWQADDHILHVLPLHHTHGIVNKLCCAMWSGAICEMLPKFEVTRVWERFINSNLTLFMAVPTIYGRLIAAWEQASPDEQATMSDACQKMRLMVSGSAALPAQFFERWADISGHRLLERYGMTELGMAISNLYEGERRVGHIGQALPGVTVRLVDEANQPITEDGQQGQIQVKGDNVFLEYWGKPEITAEAFLDGWFCTGDIAVLNDGYYRILGRSSVDIIKTGGYKVSALEIEEVLRTHPAIKECAVVGTPDLDWGERVSVAVALKSDETLSLDTLRAWGKERLASYKNPSRLLVVEALPCNVMGKVTKPAVKELFQE
ncbi:acyl-CoA synthetase [Anaerolineales bacterium HSG24]|nr:acyl-CoA synthetase [Anaerolineales bacterium HSG24]